MQGHRRRIFPQTFVDDIFSLLALDVCTPPEASRREEERCAESGRLCGQEVRFTKPCETVVAFVHKGMWRQPELCERPAARGNISQE